MARKKALAVMAVGLSVDTLILSHGLSGHTATANRKKIDKNQHSFRASENNSRYCTQTH